MKIATFEVEDWECEMFADLEAEHDLVHREERLTEDNATKHLISDDEFDKMKDGVVLINTARGPVVDVDAFLRALASGKVKAAGLDVLPEEPVVREEAELLRTWFGREHKLDTLLADHILLRLNNVISTPHSAFNTREAVQRILDTTHENIVGFARGEPVNLVSDGGGK